MSSMLRILGLMLVGCVPPLAPIRLSFFFQALLESNGTITKSQALALVTTNLENALGVGDSAQELDELVLYLGGGIFEMKSKVVGVVKGAEGVELF